jgi:putative phosphoribosyl transferase
MRFRDRGEAGELLADRLQEYAGNDEVVVLALPRGGVPVGFQLARRLRAPLDVVVVRKLGVPGREELAFGAIASGGVIVLNDSLVAALGISAERVARVVDRERLELERRERLYRDGRPPLELQGRRTIIVDDGLATGASIRAAAKAAQRRGPASTTIAVPVAARQTCDELRRDLDEVVCVWTPERFLSVNSWYDDFSQTTDEEVCRLLGQADVLAQEVARR